MVGLGKVVSEVQDQSTKFVNFLKDKYDVQIKYEKGVCRNKVRTKYSNSALLPKDQ